MSTTKRTVLLGGAILWACTGTANATVVYETYTGTIRVGYDTNGRFGAPTGDLRGKTLKLQFRFDLGAGGISSDRGNAVTSYHGGWVYGTPTVASVKVSVDGVTRDFGASYAAYLANFELLPANYYVAGVSATTESYEPDLIYDYAAAYVYSNVDNFLSSRKLGAPVDYTGSIEGSHAAYAYDNSGFGAFTESNSVHVTIGTSPVGVTEPAGLALFGLATGLLVAARRRG